MLAFCDKALCLGLVLAAVHCGLGSPVEEGSPVDLLLADYSLWAVLAQCRAGELRVKGGPVNSVLIRP